MKDRIDAQRLSQILAGEESSAAATALSPQLFQTLASIDDSLQEMLTALRRESTAEIPPGTRMAAAKKMLLRLLRVYTRRQEAFNAGVVEALTVMHRRQRLMETRLRSQDEVLKKWAESSSPGHETD
ncbi:MAG TPA: hypothetical protein VLU25_15040 [Acidobacteriota bacterium]|nr:hypothetical protein [Acidobacteriota bacterium]